MTTEEIDIMLEESALDIFIFKLANGDEYETRRDRVCTYIEKHPESDLVNIEEYVNHDLVYFNAKDIISVTVKDWPEDE